MNDKTKKYLLFSAAMALLTVSTIVLSEYRNNPASVPACDNVIDCFTSSIKITA